MNNDISIYEARSKRITEGRCKSMYYTQQLVRSPSSALCTMRADIVFSHVTSRISRLRVYHVRFDPYYLWHQSYAHQFAFPFADSVKLSSRASASSTGPVIIVDRAESHLAPLETFWPQADCSIGLLNATSWLLIVHTCIMRACECICTLIRDDRVGLASNIFKYIRYILFYITLYISVSICPRFPIYK